MLQRHGVCCSVLSAHFTEASKWLVAQCGSAVSVIRYQKVVANRSSLLAMFPTLAVIQGSWATSQDEICLVTEVSTFWIITQISSRLKSCVTVGLIYWRQMFGLVRLPWMSSQPEFLHSRYFNDNCFTLQCQSPLRLGKKGPNIGHTNAHFSQHSFIAIFSFHLGCNVGKHLYKKLEVVQARGLAMLYYSLVNFSIPVVIPLSYHICTTFVFFPR